MTTEFAAWLVKNESEIIVKQIRKYNRGIKVTKPKVVIEHDELANDNYNVCFSNVSPEVASQMKSRFDGVVWGDGHINLTMKYNESHRTVKINIKNV